MNHIDRVNRINSAAFTELPTDMLRVASPFQLMIGAAPDGHSITVGLLFDAPPPLGAIEYMLIGPQVAHLYEVLHDFMNMTPEELAALRHRLHGGSQ